MFEHSPFKLMICIYVVDHKRKPPSREFPVEDVSFMSRSTPGKSVNLYCLCRIHYNELRREVAEGFRV